ncbi:MAG TPA: hypothetical protein VK667_04350, partial [Ktedonobacteraceae bacterium]|nr:hypothetical protein [Ktedonobacteraceae bacterium]
QKNDCTETICCQPPESFLPLARRNGSRRADPGDSQEVRERSFAALRMTRPLAVILSAAKDLWCTFVQQTCLT